MRVIAGKAGSIRLKAPEGMDTRPTTDRIKETLFNMIHNELYGVNFLDLFAGSGAIGIEALSRGAQKACFVESNRKTCGIISENLKKTKLENDGEIINKTAQAAIGSLSGREKFDIVFMDPPYNKDFEKEIMRMPAFIDVLENDALVIVESDINTAFSKEDYPGLAIVKEKKYKTNKHTFFRKTNE